MNWSDIQLFEAAASTGSITAGARSLGLSQPQMSRRLKELERDLGARLFDRTPQGLRPTPAGSKLIPLAADMRAAADAVERVRPELTSTSISVVRIAVDEIRENFLTTNLRTLCETLDGVELEVFSDHQHPDHTSRETEIQIRSCLPESDTLVAKRLGRTEYALFATDDFINANLSSPESPESPDIDSQPWIGIAPDHLWYPEQKKWLDDYFRVSSTARFNTMTGMLNAARAGIGIALLPSFMVGDTTGLTRVGGTSETMTTVEYLIIHRDLLRERAIRKAVNCIADLYKSHSRKLAST